MILTLAWALALTTEDLHTATFLVDLLGDSLNPYFIPPIIFVLSALVSFSTGSSWSTMAIIYPIAIPLTWAVATGAGWEYAEAHSLLYNVISIVLAASVLGDHCSPISDTTILSSLASDCNHIDHVRTQLPYALTVGATSLVLGTLASMLGGGWMLCLSLWVIGLGFLYFVVRWRGTVVDA
jgi:Na+/H+ antiporter NhaC